MLLTLPNKYTRQRRRFRRSYLKTNSHKKRYSILNNEDSKQSFEKDKDPVIIKIEKEGNVFDLQDDELKSCILPKIAITTSKIPSERLLIFIEELRLIFPNSECITRGSHEMSHLMHISRASGVTDLIVVHEYMDVPDSLIICHLPYGLTTSFTLSGVVMHHDMPVVAQMTDQTPHVLFHNFKSFLCLKILRLLKYLLPATSEKSERVITFTNENGYISFRQHIHKRAGEGVELKEAGPRFQMKLLEMKLETPETLDAADDDWVLRPYLNRSQSCHSFEDHKYRLHVD